MKKYAIVKKRVIGYSFSHTYYAYEYGIAFRVFGPRGPSCPIWDSHSVDSAEDCERLLRESIAAEKSKYEIIRVVEA